MYFGPVSFLFLFLHSLLLPLPIHALPPQRRQSDGRSKSITTVTTTDTPLGPITVTCVIVFTPVKDAKGQDVVQEVKTCTLEAKGSSSSLPLSSSSSALSNSTIINHYTLTTSSTSSSGTGLPPSSTTTASFSLTSNQYTSTSTGASSSGTDLRLPSSTTSTLSSSSMSASSSALSSSSTAAESSSTIVSSSSSGSVPTPDSTSSTSNTVTPTSTSDVGTPSGQAPVVISGTSSPTDPTLTTTSTPFITPFTLSPASTTPVQPSAAGAIQLPGKKLSVLPIGLGVFAGISVIALIVVGLVTYERTKYRRAFRQRTLAESGAALGYGGTGY